MYGLYGDKFADTPNCPIANKLLAFLVPRILMMRGPDRLLLLKPLSHKFSINSIKFSRNWSWSPHMKQGKGNDDEQLRVTVHVHGCFFLDSTSK